ncbi:hypothetical protein NUACC21_69030 [Scytonema sp. NUACC21]
MTQKVAIVTTLRNVSNSITSFLTYHLSIGFEHIFLFFDDPKDPSINEAKKFAKVSVILNNDELQDKWKQTLSYKHNKEIREYLNSEVMARQIVNTEIAIQLARQKHLNWLLHIDSDELFYSPHQTVSEHFQELIDKKIFNARYRNFEAIPESADIEDYFKNVTLFKKNYRSTYRGELKDYLSKNQKEIINLIPQLPDDFFLFYNNGKTAAALSEEILPWGVHGFQLPIMVCGFKLPILQKQIPQWQTNVSSPLILHYPCNGFENFWKKYETLGLFPNQWYGKIDIANAMGSFHLEARDIVMSGNKKAAKEFYEKRVVINNAADIKSCMENDLFCRIVKPSKLLTEISIYSHSL